MWLEDLCYTSLPKHSHDYITILESGSERRAGNALRHGFHAGPQHLPPFNFHDANITLPSEAESVIDFESACVNTGFEETGACLKVVRN